MKLHSLPLCLFLLFLCLPSPSPIVAVGDSPFTPKAYLIRYWNNKISNDLPRPWFLINMASPLTAAQYAVFSKIAKADRNSLAAQLPEFCSSADLLCFPDLSPSSLSKHDDNVNFTSYEFQNFTNYGSHSAAGADSFKNYTVDVNLPVDTFRRYSRDSSAHTDRFSNYATGGNVADQSFHTYGPATAGGAGEFGNYAKDVNVPNLRFTAYSDDADGRKQEFKSYSENANVGDQNFTSYGKNGNGAATGFTSYGNNSNVMDTAFKNYGESGNGDADTFTSYAFNGNNPDNTFKNYGAGGNGPVDTFNSYRQESNVGADSFNSYGKKSNAADVGFVNYGKTFNGGTDKFSGYSDSDRVSFNGYGVNNTFKDYAKTGVTFAGYLNATDVTAAVGAAKGKMVNNKRWVEPGKFFREKMLKSGTIMPMPDIRDKMPKRSFLPRNIAAELPFSAAEIGELEKIFHAVEGSAMAKMIAGTLAECERAPSRDETKRCVTSVEDMIDFATAVLGRNVVVRTTETTVGAKQTIMIGSVKGINGGKLTKSVSCHQSLFPYLVYYCHSVPKVRVYEADILDPKTKDKINHGVAICHIDTSAWGATHGAFLALGSGPGKIEVCHWIFENDMTWTVAD
ncbi:PREDICTED: polygalacturonase-1 non-catalytic subunit beta-like [Ipomoea nil]|uniref:polygalacturonase-1 non-catalytic subunit beta-like n=1 Tax=Ipomoea nil TaxID=35883 RepID=UPI000901E73A|nr:PREDICTED: polygalacturonase-1 non-catalytic subunit beta-like [Ipomoea nil]